MFKLKSWPCPPLCTKCHGSWQVCRMLRRGVNAHLNQDEPNCTKCSGSSMCAECGGPGLLVRKVPAVDGQADENNFRSSRACCLTPLVRWMAPAAAESSRLLSAISRASLRRGESRRLMVAGESSCSRSQARYSWSKALEKAWGGWGRPLSQAKNRARPVA